MPAERILMRPDSLSEGLIYVNDTWRGQLVIIVYEASLLQRDTEDREAIPATNESITDWCAVSA
ncbi:MAG TPA: hypothetical protein VLJ11_21955 [Bryobacteraceae bacterium]|nr:hypothetical protein [Bryobacteraceae bacterium]